MQEHQISRRMAQALCMGGQSRSSLEKWNALNQGEGASSDIVAIHGCESDGRFSSRAKPNRGAARRQQLATSTHHRTSFSGRPKHGWIWLRFPGESNENSVGNLVNKNGCGQARMGYQRHRSFARVRSGIGASWHE